MEKSEYLDNFENVLESGLVRICISSDLSDAGLKPGGTDILRCPDIDAKWEGDYLQGYTADAVLNFNDYPDAALAWAAWLGMAVAWNWDRDWALASKAPYSSYYGLRGWDDMDENIIRNILKLTDKEENKLCSLYQSCTSSILALIRHDGIEPQTALGFYVLVRAYTVMFRLGASLELHRLRYKAVLL